MNLDKKIKVCIRGMSGLLGARLAMAIQKNPDIELVAGIVRNDESLKRILDSPYYLTLPTHMFLDEPHRVIDKLNDAQSKIRFQPADQIGLASLCDIVVDCTSPGNYQKWQERYRHFRRPVLLQSGEYPNGTLISPPLMAEKGNGNIYRQGDCILSALSPILAAFKEYIDSIRVFVVMQYGERLNDYPTSQRIHSTYLRDDLSDQLGDELGSLFKDKKVIMEGVLNVPGLDYYTITLHFDLNTSMTGIDIKGLLKNHPRIMIAPPGMASTYEVDHLLKEEAKAFGKDIPPIVVYDNDFGFTMPKKDDIRIRATVYSRLIAVLPNIDSLRVLARGMDPVEAMRLTDKYAGFRQDN